jgi:hypothetical protein
VMHVLFDPVAVFSGMLRGFVRAGHRVFQE